jgi:hypothetical protein
VREAVDRDGYSLFQIRLSLSEIPQRETFPCLNTILAGTRNDEARCLRESEIEEAAMGKGLLLWLVGVPIPVIILLWLFFGR